ncbi:aminotransferase class I/II-fold pyridoxal phosphate-dependent enzyme [Sphingobacterium sp. HMA12]|uniref:aminotransferase class I/II-fold pyridoxal phosphate-dependent enzyme n=1 Tax=Sphingobacterium sp. HMA12 TaxID=2050894 RepID=UPI000CEA5003|nr:aminotransferase class I/II-fold pyridoxal phosphate-dependent enzyme [Sphingobacterium sp. HMA12]
MKNFTKLDQPTGRSIYLDGKEYLFFGGTSYLGLATDRAYTELFIEGIKRYGINNGTSRSNNVQQAIFDQAEAYASGRFGFEAGLLLSSGYLATQFVVKMLSNEGELLYAPSSHPALWLDANPGITGDFRDWSLRTVEYINQSKATSFVVVSNSLDNMKPERYDFSVFGTIAADKRVTLVLDDSHGIGVLSENGISLTERDFLDANIELIVVASLAKGLATDAGLILASQKRIAEFKKSNFYTGASPSSPASLYAFVNGEQIYRKQFEKLQENILYFASLSKGYLNTVANFPVFSSNDISLYERLMEASILVSSFPYPLPTDPLLNRIVVNAHHTREDLERISHAIGIS